VADPQRCSRERSDRLQRRGSPAKNGVAIFCQVHPFVYARHGRELMG
jgi:hypothetical protein